MPQEEPRPPAANITAFDYSLSIDETDSINRIAGDDTLDKSNLPAAVYPLGRYRCAGALFAKRNDHSRSQNKNNADP